MAYSYSDDSFGEGLYSAENTEENTAISSWSFSVDGHTFVFVKLGIQGTYVYDTSTGQWLAWSRDDVIGLGFTGGQPFDEFCMMGSTEDGSIYTFDPEELDDFSGEFTSVVTGGITARARETLSCNAAYVAGNRSDETDREVELFYSDDNGVTWNSAGAISPDGEDDLAWRSIGLIRNPGRIFEIRDNGALKSIDGLDMESSSGS